jgi:Tfp pilus assembly protein PilV
MTLAELLVATLILGIGLVALMGLIPISSYGAQEGKQGSTATFLAAQRLEEARNAPWTANNDCLGLGPSAAPTVPLGASCSNGAVTIAAGGVTLADEATVAGSPGYGRSLRITDCTAGCAGITSATLRSAMVTVTYTPLTGVGVSPTTKTVSLTMLISRR